MSTATKKPKTKLLLLYIGSFAASVLPLLICFIVNWDRYTKTPGDTVKLCIGGMIALLFIFMKVIGKLQMPRRIVLFGVVFVMAYLLKAILNDLPLISGMALAGEFIDYILFQRAIKVTKENILVSKSADATTAQVEAVIQKYIGRV